jgi:hypothetical protein
MGMDKLSDRMDLLDKGIELYNYYVGDQRRSITDEIMWLVDNSENTDKLRAYFSQFLSKERLQHFTDKDIEELAQIRGNHLYAQLKGLGCKIDTVPLKVIVQCLKNSGY